MAPRRLQFHTEPPTEAPRKRQRTGPADREEAIGPIFASLQANMAKVPSIAAIDLREFLVDGSTGFEELEAAVRGVVADIAGLASVAESSDLDDLAHRIRGSSVHGMLSRRLVAAKSTAINLIRGPALRIAALVAEAFAAVEALTFSSSVDRSRVDAAWDADIAQFGISARPIPTIPPASAGAYADLLARIESTVPLLTARQSVTWRSADRQLLLGLVSDVHTEPIGTEIRATYCPKLSTVLKYANWDRLGSARNLGRLVATLIDVCDSIRVDERIQLAHQFLYSLSPHFDNVRETEIIRLVVDASTPELVVEGSRQTLESTTLGPKFAHGIMIRHKASVALGDGLRRSWFSQVVPHYFAPHIEHHDDEDSLLDAVVDSGPDGVEATHSSDSADPSHPEADVEPPMRYWVFADESHSTLRPRSFGEMPTKTDRQRLFLGLLASGRLIGIGLRYGITAGIRLSPASLSLLQNPGEGWNLGDLCRQEDSAFWSGLEKIREFNWTEPSVIEIASEMGVTQDGANQYILKQQFERVVSSIRDPMMVVLRGINDVIRPGTMDVLSPAELAVAIGGPRELTPDMVINAFILPGDQVGEKHVMGAWFVDIVKDMTPIELAKLHKFVTGSPHPPIGGGLNGNRYMLLQLHGARGTHLLPTAATCFKTLKTPIYDTPDKFRSKLHIAIEECVTIEEY